MQARRLDHTPKLERLLKACRLGITPSELHLRFSNINSAINQANKQNLIKQGPDKVYRLTEDGTAKLKEENNNV